MLAKVVQTEVVAFAAWNDIGKGRPGKSVGKGSKGEKGSGKKNLGKKFTIGGGMFT